MAKYWLALIPQKEKVKVEKKNKKHKKTKE